MKIKYKIKCIKSGLKKEVVSEDFSAFELNLIYNFYSMHENFEIYINGELDV